MSSGRSGTIAAATRASRSGSVSKRYLSKYSLATWPERSVNSPVRRQRASMSRARARSTSRSMWLLSQHADPDHRRHPLRRTRHGPGSARRRARRDPAPSQPDRRAARGDPPAGRPERRPVGARRRPLGRHDRRVRLRAVTGTAAPRGARGPRRSPPLRVDGLGVRGAVRPRRRARTRRSSTSRPTTSRRSPTRPTGRSRSPASGSPASPTARARSR